jgi:tetratricopeptide (TPR) repeat protein
MRDRRALLLCGALCLFLASVFFAPVHSQVDAPAAESTAPDLSNLTTEELLSAARTAVENGYFTGAEALYQALLVRDRQNVEAILELATVYERTGKFEYARGLLQRAAVLRPNDKNIMARNLEIGATLSAALHEQIDSLIARQQYSLALPKLSMLLTVEPENPMLHYQKALCHLKLQNPQMALQIIDEALRIQKDESFYKLRAEAVDAQKKATVIEYVKRAIDLMKTGTVADNQEALQLVGKILQLDPEHEWAKQAFIRLTGEGVSQPAEVARNIDGETSAEPEDTVTASNRFKNAGADLLHFLGLVKDRLAGVLLVLASIAALLAILLLVKRWIFTPDPPLTGKLSHFNLRDVLTLLNMTARTGLLKVQAKTIAGEIHFDNGEARHCKVGRQEGIQALDSLLSGAREGHFTFIDTPSSFKKTIETPLSLVLMGGYSRKSSDSNSKSSRAAKKPRSRMKELLDSRK